MRMQTSFNVQPAQQQPTQRSGGMHVDPEPLRHLAEQATQIVVHTPPVQYGIEGVKQIGQFLNSDSPFIRNATSLFGSVLGGVGAGFAYVKFIRETPAAKLAKISEGVQAQKTKLDEPCITMQEWLEEVAEHCKEAIKDPKTYYAITPTSQKMADKAQAVMESALARETISNEFEANLTGKKGLDFSTLTISGMRANAQFPKVYWYDTLANAARDTWLEERAINVQKKEIGKKKAQRRLQPSFDAREANVKQFPPVKRFQFERDKAPFGEWRNFKTTYGNMRKANLAKKLFVWNNFNGSDFSEANLYKTKWFNNDIEQCDFQGVRLRKSRISGINGWRTDFSPYIENSYKEANCIYRPAHLEDTIFYATDYDPHILDAWIDVNNNLPKADFRGAHLQRVTFQQANLRGAKFGAVQINPQLVKPDEILYDERNVWNKFPPPQAANLTGAILGDVDMREIEADGAVFEDMTFLGTVPKAVSLAMPDGKTTMHYRTVRDTPIVSFEKAKLQNTSWKNTEFCVVDKDGNALPPDKKRLGVHFAGADLSGAHFENSLVSNQVMEEMVDDIMVNYNQEKMEVLKQLFQGSYFQKNNAPILTMQPYSQEVTKKLLRDLGIKQKGWL